MTACLTSDELADALLGAVRGLRLAETPDHGQNGGQPVAELPSLDLSVIAFPEGCPPAWANVLFSRDLPEGRVATIEPDTLRVSGVRWIRDQRDPETGDSVLWAKGADWDRFDLQPIVPGLTGERFVVPYPASSLKLMTAVGILRLVQRRELGLEDLFGHEGRTLPVSTWLDEMITVSSNEATFALNRVLHSHGEIVAQVPEAELALPCQERTRRREAHNALNAAFASLGLGTLRYESTRPCDGSFFNSGGSGVGHHHMTSWDAVRLLWLLDPRAPSPSWQVDGRPVDPDFLSAELKRLLVDRLLGQQALHEALSSTLLCGVAGRVQGLPATLPRRWYADPAGGDYSVTIGGASFTRDGRPCEASAEVLFAHKTGLTENFASDLGIVRGLGAVRGGAGPRRHYLIAFFSSLGSRYGPECDERGLCYPQRVPALGKAVDDFLKQRLER